MATTCELHCLLYSVNCLQLSLLNRWLRIKRYVSNFARFPCRSCEATLRCSSLQCRLMHLSGYGKSISVWAKTDFWYIIELCGASFLDWDKTLRSIAPIFNNSKLFPVSVPISMTFMGGDDHIDSSIIMREAFGWRVSSCVASWGKGPQSRVNSELFTGSCFLIGRFCRCNLGPAQCFHNAFDVVCFLSYSMRVNQNPQWVEGRREMDIDVMWLRISLLCVLACIVSVQFSALFFHIAISFKKKEL